MEDKDAPTPHSDRSSRLAVCLYSDYGLELACLTPHGSGLDAGATTFKATSTRGEMYFVKVRQGAFKVQALEVPNTLAEHDVPGIIAPVATLKGALSAQCGPESVVLFPFIEGAQAGADGLSESQWRELGRVLEAVHNCPLRQRILATVPVEAFDLASARSVRQFLQYLDTPSADGYGADRYRTLLADHRHTVDALLLRAEGLRMVVNARLVERVVCHADVHPWNIMVEPSGRLRLVDWEDGPLLAPKERDFIFVPDEYLGAFLQGYGDQVIDREMIDYFWAERLVEDIASTAELVFNSVGVDQSLVDQYIDGQMKFFAHTERSSQSKSS
jgi:spectinomycin phosphotransferase